MGRFFYVLGYAIAAIIVGIIVLRRLMAAGPLRIEHQPGEEPAVSSKPEQTSR